MLSQLYLLPLAVRMAGDEDTQRVLWQLSPSGAGLAVQATTDAALPLTPWAGLGVPAAWAAAALPTGWPLLVRRDA
ncbi:MULTISPECIES: hypothetical protein [unclassified Nonomuraea]|uniref:hypothetical protein n=1 Tax=unclassified Nonomuraea TaxID=2593643 RepID=UPI00191BDB34|nr:MULTISPECIES: hypothetical protein [unclassified Nonomuraea]